MPVGVLLVQPGERQDPGLVPRPSNDLNSDRQPRLREAARHRQGGKPCKISPGSQRIGVGERGLQLVGQLRGDDGHRRGYQEIVPAEHLVECLLNQATRLHRSHVVHAGDALRGVAGPPRRGLDELTHAAGRDQRLERRRCLHDDYENCGLVVGVVGELCVGNRHPESGEFPYRLFERRGHVGVIDLSEVGTNHANAVAPRIGRFVHLLTRRRVALGGGIAGVGPGNRLQDEAAIFGGPRHGTDLVHRPREGHRSGPRHTTVRGTETGHSVERRRAQDRSPGLGADRESDQGRRSGGTGAGRRAAAPPPAVPGVARRAARGSAGRVVPEPSRELDHGELRHENGTGVAKAADDRRVFGKHLTAERTCPPAGRNAPGREKILGAVGDSMKRPAVVTGSDLLLGAPRFLERALPSQRRNRVERLSGRFQASERRFRESNRR